MAQGRTVQAPQIKQHLDSVIDDVMSDPFHEAKSQVGTLQRISDSLPEDGNVPVNDILDLRKFTNKFFNPARITDKSTTYGKLNSVADNALETAKQQIPDFGPALNIADRYWANNVAQPFTNNKVLQKMWSPQDAHNLRLTDEGFLDEPGDLTSQRANNLVSNIKDVDSYNAVRRTLPDDTGQELDQQVLNNIAPNRLSAMVRAAKSALNAEPLNTLSNVKQAVLPSETDATKTLRSAVKSQDTYTPLSTKNDLAQAAFENLQKAHMRGANNPPALEAPSTKVPPGGFQQEEPTPLVATPAEPDTGQKLLGNQFYAPDSRALTYQPKADFEVSPEGWASKPTNPSIRQNPDVVGPMKDAQQSLSKTSTKTPYKQLTYQPQADFVGTENGIVQKPRNLATDPYLLGEEQGMPMPLSESNKVNPKWPAEKRGGPINKKKGGAVWAKPRSYPALENRK